MNEFLVPWIRGYILDGTILQQLLTKLKAHLVECPTIFNDENTNHSTLQFCYLSRVFTETLLFEEWVLNYCYPLGFSVLERSVTTRNDFPYSNCRVTQSETVFRMKITSCWGWKAQIFQSSIKPLSRSSRKKHIFIINILHISKLQHKYSLN